MTRQPAPLTFSTFFGLLMVGAATGGGMAARIAAGLALTAVVAGVFHRSAATVAVLATVAALALGDISTLFAAVSGLAAAAYLVIRHAVGTDVVTTTAPTVLAMLGFAAVATAASAIPWRPAWVPLLAPAVVVAVVAVVGAGLFRRDSVRYE